MVACAGRYHSPLAFRLAQCQQLIQRSPLLERARALQVFELQVNGQAGQLRQMVGKMAGRNMNGFADARARRVNTCQADGFQGVSSCLQLHCTVEVNEPNKKPPPRLRGGLCLSERLLCQAFLYPARMDLLIRIAGIHAVGETAGKKVELGEPERMTISGVEQTAVGAVKTRRARPAQQNFT